MTDSSQGKRNLDASRSGSQDESKVVNMLSGLRLRRMLGLEHGK